MFNLFIGRINILAIRNLMKFGDSALRKKAREVTEFDEKLAVLIDDMKETMQEKNGVGLAAPQVGVLKRVALVDVGDENGLVELINPVITKIRGRQRQLEGCLSSNGEWGYVVRPQVVVVKAQNRQGEEFEIKVKDLLAVAVCHETDHLNGIIFTDLADELVDKDEAERQRKNRRKSKNTN
jgi:peptide deformylase